MIVDSHCHLNYLEDPEGAIDRARRAGVTHILTIGVDPGSTEAAVGYAARHKNVFASAGAHPSGVSGDITWIKAYLEETGVVAVGETGLDFHYESTPAGRAHQLRAFEAQLALAVEYDLPVIVHTRNAERETLELIAAFPGLKGVLHCFTESLSMAEEALAHGFYISISGIATFRNGANVREIAGAVPTDRLLIETDAPWLAPVPHRGGQNEPDYVVHTAETVAEIREISVEELAQQTSDNFFRLFDRAQRNRG